jgi:hypothetical protein
MSLVPTMLLLVTLAVDQVECTPWGGAAVRGTVAHADACGLVIAIDGSAARISLAWSDVRTIAPVDPAWSSWIEAGDAVRRGSRVVMQRSPPRPLGVRRNCWPARAASACRLRGSSGPVRCRPAAVPPRRRWRS